MLHVTGPGQYKEQEDLQRGRDEHAGQRHHGLQDRLSVCLQPALERKTHTRLNCMYNAKHIYKNMCVYEHVQTHVRNRFSFVSGDLMESSVCVCVVENNSLSDGMINMMC